MIRRLIDERPTCGGQRMAALLSRELTRQGRPLVNRKRVTRIMELLLEPCRVQRPRRLHDGEVMVGGSNLRWCSDALGCACWNGEVIRMAFVIDAFDREIIAFTASAARGSAVRIFGTSCGRPFRGAQSPKARRASLR